jgi:hypothetical protein
VRNLSLIAMALAVIVLGPAGCVKMDQDVKLNDDGSSVVKIHYAMREEHVAQMQAMQGMGMPGTPGASGAPDAERMQAMMKQLQEMQKRMGTTPGGTPAAPFDMKELAKQMEAMRKGAKPPAKGTGPASPAATPKPEKSVKEQVEDMKKQARKDAGLEVKKPSAPRDDDLRKQIEDMKRAARKEAQVGKGEKLKPEVPAVEKPKDLRRPTSPAPSMGAAGLGGLLFDEKEIRKQFAERKKDGVELKDVKVVTKDGWRHAYITSTCKDLGAATRVPAGGGRGGNMGLTKDADGNYVLVLAHPRFGKMSGGASPEERKAELARARKSMPGFRMSVTLTVPGDVVKTNAHKKSGRTVNWVLDVDDEKFPEKCQALDREGMKVVFEGEGLKLKTFKPTTVQ